MISTPRENPYIQAVLKRLLEGIKETQDKIDKIKCKDKLK